MGGCEGREATQLTAIPGIRNRVFRTLLCELVPTLEIIIVRDTIGKAILRDMASLQFGDMVKAVVDVETGIMAIGGELHSDEEAILLDNRFAPIKSLGNQLVSGKAIR